MSYKTTRLFSLLMTFLFAALINSQDHWVPVNSPTNQNLRRVHFADSLTGWVVGDAGTIIYTENGGQTWTEQESPVETAIKDVYFVDHNNGWALTWNETIPGGTIILKTNNGGDTWTAEDYPIAAKFMQTIFFVDTLNGWMGGKPSSFVYTTNGGIEWNEVEFDSGAHSHFPVLNFTFYNAQYGFANGGEFDLGGVIWKTTNGGKNWFSMSVGPEPIQEIVFFDSLNALAVGGDFEYGTGIVRTSNGGQSWEYTSLGIVGVAWAVSFRSESEGWACLGTAHSLIVTNDSGKTWTAIPSPDNAIILDLQFTDSLHGYAVGDSGRIYKFNPLVVGIRHQRFNALPFDYELAQNYPNPFNPVTNLRFQIPELGPVSLKVYDITGREVAVFVNEEKSPGEYSVQWDASEFASGVYICKLVAGRYVQSRKMLLLK